MPIFATVFSSFEFFHFFVETLNFLLILFSREIYRTILDVSLSIKTSTSCEVLFIDFVESVHLGLFTDEVFEIEGDFETVTAIDGTSNQD